MFLHFAFTKSKIKELHSYNNNNTSIAAHFEQAETPPSRLRANKPRPEAYNWLVDVRKFGREASEEMAWLKQKDITVASPRHGEDCMILMFVLCEFARVLEQDTS